MNQAELQNRLIKFSNSIIELTRNMEEGFAAQHLARQIIRSGTSCSLNYGEAQGAPTKKDFINKSSIVLKELRETSATLQIMKESKLIRDEKQLADIFQENSELIAIFTKTVLTAKKNLGKDN